MVHQMGSNRVSFLSLIIFLISGFFPFYSAASDLPRVSAGNFGLPGIVDLPTARRFSDGELVITHQNHENLFMTGISFQALPQLGVSFRYGGLGNGGGFAQNRLTWDRSFDAHISILDETTYFPAISFGLRDFIGTGWYSSEYIVGTKSLGNLELTAGLGFGRLAGRNVISNPLSALFKGFDQRDTNSFKRGGTLGTINWFQGDAAVFYGMKYQINEKVTTSLEYTSDLMLRESAYLKVTSPWNLGATYQINDHVGLSAQYLYGDVLSFTAQVSVNPSRPPLSGGKELAPVPMRLRGKQSLPIDTSNEQIIRKVLSVDGFEIHHLNFESDTANIGIKNTKFRSTAQAVGRVTSTLQRFTSDKIKNAKISFYSRDLQTATYLVNLEQVTAEQFFPVAIDEKNPSIEAIDLAGPQLTKNKQKLTWGIGPYIAHRLFNPDLPLSIETGVEVSASYQIAGGLRIAGDIRKSILTNLTDNKRRSNSSLPRVHSDWPLYDIAGQSGHIHELTLSHVKNLAPGLYSRLHAGFLEPFFAGFGGEILYKPAQSPIGVSLDIHRVRKRDYQMRFDLLDYKATVGHVSVYYDSGGLFDIEINAGRYLAGDWGATMTISRKFGSGWEVGGYATFTDVPFDTFGEGSFDKAIYVSVPIDWVISSPNKTKRRLTLRPITRDGGAQLSGSRRLYRQIEDYQNASFQREIGRLWK